MAERIHLLRIAAHDRPGTIEAIAAAFSSRGISLDAFCAARGAGDAHGITLAFRAKPERRDQMVRILQRMPCVKSVEAGESVPGHPGLPCLGGH